MRALASFFEMAAYFDGLDCSAQDFFHAGE